jgi:hypothetical protein
MGMKPLRLAADTNVLLGLADGVESVLDALAVIERRLPENRQARRSQRLGRVGLSLRLRPESRPSQVSARRFPAAPRW